MTIIDRLERLTRHQRNYVLYDCLEYTRQEVAAMAGGEDFDDPPINVFAYDGRYFGTLGLLEALRRMETKLGLRAEPREGRF